MLEEKLQELKSLNGYKASAVVDYTGAVLAYDAVAVKAEDLAYSAATFNDIFRMSHKASKDLLIGTTKTMEILTEKNIVLMACSGEESRLHIHMFLIMDKEGNHTLGRMQMDRMLPKILDELVG